MIGTAAQIIIWLTRQQNKDQNYEIKEYRDKSHRSLNSNSYFWVLVNKIAKVQRISDTDVHDHLLRDNREYILNKDGVVDWKVSPEAPNKYGILKEPGIDGYSYYIDSGNRVVLHRETGETIIGKTGEQITGRVYWHIKGTRQMNVDEMNRILDAAIFEAEQLDIEVASPDELSRMSAIWEKEYAKYVKKHSD